MAAHTYDAPPRERRRPQAPEPPEPSFSTLLPRPQLTPLTEVQHPTYETPLTTPTSGCAVLALLLGIGVFVTFGFTGLPAVLFGHFAWADTSTGERAGHGLTVAGLFLGYLAIAAWVAAIVFFATAGRDVQLPVIHPTVTVTH